MIASFVCIYESAAGNRFSMFKNLLCFWWVLWYPFWIWIWSLQSKLYMFHHSSYLLDSMAHISSNPEDYSTPVCVAMLWPQPNMFLVLQSMCITCNYIRKQIELLQFWNCTFTIQKWVDNSFNFCTSTYDCVALSRQVKIVIFAKLFYFQNLSHSFQWLLHAATTEEI